MLRQLIVSLTALAAVSACAVIDTGTASAPIDRTARWAVLPIVNHTDVPQAGLRAEAITEGVLRARGVGGLTKYPPTLNPESLFEPSERRAQLEAQDWAKKNGVRYGVTGAVDEWRYKVGVDGEPAVGVALQVIDLESGAVVWSAVGAKSGWSRESLAGVAQKLIRELLAGAQIR